MDAEGIIYIICLTALCCFMVYCDHKQRMNGK